MKAFVCSTAILVLLAASVFAQSKISDIKQPIEPRAIEYFDIGADCEESDVYCQISNYSKAIKIDSSFAEAFNNRGMAYRISGDNERALADFNRAVELEPKFSQAIYNRALLFTAVGKEESAVRDLTSAIE